MLSSDRGPACKSKPSVASSTGRRDEKHPAFHNDRTANRHGCVVHHPSVSAPLRSQKAQKSSAPIRRFPQPALRAKNIFRFSENHGSLPPSRTPWGGRLAIVTDVG